MNSRLYCVEARSMPRKVIRALSFFVVSLLLPAFATAGEAPDWLRVLAKQQPKTYADDVDAVVLLDDQSTTVKDNGDIVIHGRVALRILRTDGRKFASYPVTYDGDSKVSYLRAW